MLIAGSINFVVFLRRRNEYESGGALQRTVESIREVTGVDGRVLSSEVFAPNDVGQATAHAPLTCADELRHYDYDDGVRERWA